MKTTDCKSCAWAKTGGGRIEIKGKNGNRTIVMQSRGKNSIVCTCPQIHSITMLGASQMICSDYKEKRRQ